MQRFIAIILVLIGCLAAGNRCYGQFNNGFVSTAPPGANVESTTNTSDNDEVIMSKKPAFTVGRYFKALAHKDSMKVNQMAIGSMILPGTAQIYNEQYWKLPVVYGAIGGCIGGAIATDNKDTRGYLIAGAVACYWGSVLDGVISYKSNLKPHPGRAAMLSAVVPGLGQAYNGDYWKIPVFYTGLGICAYALNFNQEQYKRYRRMYVELNEGTYTGHLTAENITWYRDQHRRLRDYSIIATILVYALNIVDANVFAHFNTFDISDDLTLNVEPALINPVTGNWKSYAYSQMPQSFGLQMNIRF